MDIWNSPNYKFSKRDRMIEREYFELTNKYVEGKISYEDYIKSFGQEILNE